MTPFNINDNKHFVYMLKLYATILLYRKQSQNHECDGSRTMSVMAEIKLLTKIHHKAFIINIHINTVCQKFPLYASLQPSLLQTEIRPIS